MQTFHSTIERFSLNDEQILPVLETEGAVLVLAGAGSGKTRVLTSRIAYLIEEKGVYPSSILSITFTNKAAKEMKDRLSSMTDVEGMWVCTIHSMCVKMLRMFAEKRGLTENFSIYSEQERSAVIKQSYKECEGLEEEDDLKSVKWHISNAKMLGLTPEEYRKKYDYEKNIDLICKVYVKYILHLKQNNALDFDDLLLEARALLAEDEEALEYFAGKFRYIHVDEFQDTNAVQFDIIKMLASKHGNLFVVGDDDQSIYGWRGAKIENILHFERSYPKAKTYKLQRNYRSTKHILDLANASIAHNKMRKAKALWTENEEGDKPVWFEADEEAGEALYCARIISEYRRRGYRLSDFAVLMRVNALTRSYEQEFTKYGIAHKVFGGFKFFERKEVKDILAYLRVIANPCDSEAVARIINVPRRGIGEKTVQTLNEYAAREDLTLYDAIFDADTLPLNASTKAKLASFKAFLIDLIMRSQELPVDKLTEYLIKTAGLREMYADDSDESVAKRANIDEFQNSVDEFVRMNEGATLSDYLQQITLYSDTDDMDDGDYVTLATIHAVKGLEFRCVFFCGLEDSIIPTGRAIDNPNDLEEERRLVYVAITRAKEKLWLTRSRSRFLYGRREPTGRSRFVEEIKEQLGIEDAPRYRRFGDDYEDGYETRRYPSRPYGGYGGGYGGGNTVVRKYSTASEEEGGYRTFGGSAKPARPSSGGASRFGNVGARGLPMQKNGEKDVSRFAVGTRVRHAKFGDGIVTAMRGAGKNVILTVAFEVAGNKDLAAGFAPLEILE
ncbi:MAG: UvrD-helicase domain-containing protein [Clostridia bacterium]|nr:UvrD-helicase domain-containing protein [Clostridia bacterium]